MLPKRRTLLNSSDKRKVESSANVDLARGRLKGALKTGHHSTDESSEEIDDSAESGREFTKRRRDETVPAVPQPYLMKFFDRHIDLSRFNEKSSLYAMCRAWYKNHPTPRGQETTSDSSKTVVFKREYNPEIVENFLNGQVNEIREMPLPESAGNMEPYDQQTVHPVTDFKINTATMGKEELLEEHLVKWKHLRKSWISHRKQYKERRYETSFRLLDAIAAKSRT
ncbi:protein lin-37 homolog [Anopheles darlingi]|uniref:protein lin-37 homolog n=1 Tax=Anopheles darlingi TaxID=43151 RepID=UPI00210043F8|nr:protein lin-37 homolog [Anopheles darlingi]